MYTAASLKAQLPTDITQTITTTSSVSPMAFSSVMHLAVLSCLALLAATAAAHRPPPPPTASAPALEPPPLAGLAQRLEGEGSQQCWEALVEVKSCTGEIILYLLNGEAYLGPGCCRAIRVIEQSCWAADAMLSAIGFTPEEGDMLKGYCDAGDDDNGGAQHGAPPPAASGSGVAARESVFAAAGRKKCASAHC